MDMRTFKFTMDLVLGQTLLSSLILLGIEIIIIGCWHPENRDLGGENDPPIQHTQNYPPTEGCYKWNMLLVKYIPDPRYIFVWFSDLWHWVCLETGYLIHTQRFSLRRLCMTDLKSSTICLTQYISCWGYEIRLESLSLPVLLRPHSRSKFYRYCSDHFEMKIGMKSTCWSGHVILCNQRECVGVDRRFSGLERVIGQVKHDTIVSEILLQGLCARIYILSGRPSDCFVMEDLSLGTLHECTLTRLILHPSIYQDTVQSHELEPQNDQQPKYLWLWTHEEVELEDDLL